MTSARRAAVLGHPIAHSLSPVLHRAAYASLGLDWSYDAVDVTADQLPEFIRGLDGSWAGLSLTMPLKQTVIGLLDHIEPLAEIVGAVNTVVVNAVGSSLSLVGANTDVYGLVTALREGLAPGSGTPADPVRSAVVIGAGATAASTLAALAEVGCPTPLVLVRALGRTGGLQRVAHKMGVRPRFALLDKELDQLPSAEVVVSTLPPHAADPLAERLAGSRARGVLLDVAYDPRPTALGRAWAAAGGVVVGGERMLMHQAAEQVRLMTGRAAPVIAMEGALSAALAPAFDQA